MVRINRLPLTAAPLVLIPLLLVCGWSCRSGGGNSSSSDYYASLTWCGRWSHGIDPDPAKATADPLLVSVQVQGDPARQGDGDRRAQALLAVQDWVQASGGRVALQLLVLGDARVPDIIVTDGTPIQTTNPPTGWTEGGGVPAADRQQVQGPTGTQTLLTVSLHPTVTCYIARNIWPDQVRGTVRHELGHACGLSHSPTKGDVMHPTATPSGISGRDLRTLTKVYGVSSL